jgi:hypothetical protein
MKGITTELAFRIAENRHEQALPLTMMTEDGGGEEKVLEGELTNALAFT